MHAEGKKSNAKIMSINQSFGDNVDNVPGLSLVTKDKDSFISLNFTHIQLPRIQSLVIFQHDLMICS